MSLAFTLCLSILGARDRLGFIPIRDYGYFVRGVTTGAAALREGDRILLPGETAPQGGGPRQGGGGRQGGGRRGGGQGGQGRGQGNPNTGGAPRS